jgi:nucleoside-diphosphate-sugar epimerase
LVEEVPRLLENPYIATKVASSELVRIFSATYRGHIIYGSFFQVYGPGDDSGNVLTYAARSLKAGRTSTFGSGNSRRDWIFVTDAAAAVLASIKEKGCKSVEYDIGTGELTSIRGMLTELVGIAGKSMDLLSFNPSNERPEGEQELRAERVPPDWRPSVAIKSGLCLLYNEL